MARFYTTATNGRGNEVGIGGRGSAGPVHLRGWNAGVRLVPIAGERDSFEIYMTYGSHASGRDVLIGTVRDTPDGPRFEPVDAILGQDNAPSWVMYAMGEDDSRTTADNNTYRTPNHP
jgi:hypothetical protein